MLVLSVTRVYTAVATAETLVSHSHAYICSSQTHATKRSQLRDIPPYMWRMSFAEVELSTTETGP